VNSSKKSGLWSLALSGISVILILTQGFAVRLKAYQYASRIVVFRDSDCVDDFSCLFNWRGAREQAMVARRNMARALHSGFVSVYFCRIIQSR
jgi:hypothetical protein